MKKLKSFMVISTILFALTFRVAIINEYTAKLERTPWLKVDVDMISDVERYPLFLLVNDPYRVFVFTKVNGKITHAAIKKVELLLSDKTIQTYDHQKYAEVIPINDDGVNFVLKNICLPPEDVELRISVRIEASLEESDHLIECKLTYDRKIEFGNYFYDRLMAI